MQQHQHRELLAEALRQYCIARQHNHPDDMRRWEESVVYWSCRMMSNTTVPDAPLDDDITEALHN